MIITIPVFSQYPTPYTYIPVFGPPYKPQPIGTYHSGYGKVYQVYLDPVKGKAYYNRTKTAKFYFSKKVTAKFLVK
jgi:hypothetical protein